MRRSPQTYRLLLEMLKRPQAEHFGLDLARSTGLASGTLYPILMRLEKMNWLTSDWEDIDPKVEGRPPRRYYKFDGNGVRNAEAYVRDMQPQTAPSGALAYA